MKKRGLHGLPLLGAFAILAPLAVEARLWLDFDDPEILLRPPRTNDEFFFRDSAAARRTFQGDPLAPQNWCWRNRKLDLLVELEELQAALEATGLRGDALARSLGAYRDYRRQAERKQANRQQLPPRQRLEDDFAKVHQRFARWRGLPQLRKLPEGGPDDLARVPGEFLLYAEGARHFWKGKLAEARATWQRLLALPADQRRYRSVWAAWMIAKSEADEERAREWFEKTIALSRDPAFHDSLRLADLARGWLLQSDPPRGDQFAALHSQWQRFLTGSERAFRVLSLAHGGWVLHRLDEEGKAAHRSDPVARLILLPTHRRAFPRKLPGPEGARKRKPDRLSFEFIEACAARADLLPGERTDLATACYAAGGLDRARALLRAETHPRPQTHWLRAKVAAWDGDFKRALQHLEAAKDSFLQHSPHEGWFARWNPEVNPSLNWYGMDTILYLRRTQYWRDLGILRLTNADFEGALAAFLEGDARPWAAYVMHHVLTTAELTRIVDRVYPAGVDPRHSRASYSHDVFTGYRAWAKLEAYENPLPNFVRHALARRLVAERQYRRASGYFGEPYRLPATILAGLVEKGRDQDRPNRARAAALWSAARLLYSHSCHFGLRPPFAHRLPPEQWHDYWRLGTRFPACLGQPNEPQPQSYPPPSPGELARQRAVNWPADFRGHPWFDAARLAWEAAALLPDNDEEAAPILCHAGCWIMHHHPLKADRYYKALAHRHPGTPLGKKALSKGWFPLTQSAAKPYLDPAFQEFARSAGLSATRPGPRWPFQYGWRRLY